MQEFLAGIAGNIVSAVIIAVVPLTLIVARLNRRQRRIASFFGLGPGTRSIHILLSRYQPEVGVEYLEGGASSTGWIHETVAVDEFRGAQALRDLFDSNWVVASFWSIVSGSVLGKRDFGAIEVTVDPVPRPAVSPSAGTVVLLGTGAKESNRLAEELLGGDADHSVFRFVKNENGRAFERMAVKGFSEERFSAAKYAPAELAVLQRATMSDGRVVFLCAGKDAPGSRMAAEFLASNWKTLHEEFGGRNNGDFARLLAFDGSYKNSKILSGVP